jgi:hypothetical protein
VFAKSIQRKGSKVMRWPLWLTSTTTVQAWWRHIAARQAHCVNAHLLYRQEALVRRRQERYVARRRKRQRCYAPLRAHADRQVRTQGARHRGGLVSKDGGVVNERVVCIATPAYIGQLIERFEHVCARAAVRELGVFECVRSELTDLPSQQPSKSAACMAQLQS